MANSDKSSSSPASLIPPPLDPFPTYQTPYPSDSSQDDNNPFISFRRFADEQFSAFFAGIPRLLGVPEHTQFRTSSTDPSANVENTARNFERALTEQANKLEQRIAEMVKKRAEEAEGFKKQIEQEMEERRRESERQIEEREHQRWAMLKRGFENCPELRNNDSNQEGQGDRCQQEQEDNSRQAMLKRGLEKCPGMQADALAAAQTELEMYEKLDQQGTKLPVEQEQRPYTLAHVSQDPVLRRPRPMGYMVRAPVLGHDGKARNISSSPRPLGFHHWEKASHTDNEHNIPVENLAPFERDHDLQLWLTLSKYSPVNLAFPDHPGLSQMVPEIKERRLLSNNKKVTDLLMSPPTELDHEMASHLPWLDAFEDLFRLSKTGDIQPRDTKDMYRMFPVQDWIDAKGPYQKAGWPNRSVTKSDHTLTAESHKDNKSGIHDAEDSRLDQMSPFGLFGARGLPWPTPETILALIDRANNLEVEAKIAGASSNSAKDEEDKSTRLGQPSSWSSSSTSMSSWTTGDHAQPGNIVSTLTTTRTKTLPDGSSETRRVLKKRFADGTEERNEKVEVTPAAARPSPRQKISAIAADKETQTPEESITRQRDVGRGWFWN